MKTDQGASASRKPALVASPSSPQAVSTKGFDPARMFGTAQQRYDLLCLIGRSRWAKNPWLGK